jgi:general secretion pathway protein G
MVRKAKFQFLILLTVVTYTSAGCRSESYYKELAHSHLARMQIPPIEEAIQDFKKDTSRFPTTAEGLDALAHNPGNLVGWNGPYWPGGVPLDPWGRAYIYKCPGDHGLFDLYSSGHDGVAGTDDDIGNWEHASDIDFSQE